MRIESCVGIDVGKSWLDVVQLPGREHRRLANGEEGWAELVAWLPPEPVVVLEATGGYEQGVVRALASAGVAVTVGNPLQLRRYAQSRGQRAKTDRVDAVMLAQYAEQMQPQPSALPDETARTVAAFVTRRRQLSQMRAEEKTRQKQPGLLAIVQQQLAEHITELSAQISAVDCLMAETVAADPHWQQRVNQLVTVPGIAQLTAVRLLVGLPELGQCSAKTIAGLVGVAPYPQESGQYRGRRVIAGGRRWVRHALFEAVMSTKRCDPTMRAHYAQLRARGKPHKVAMVACMRRLLGILTAMVRHALNWQQTKVGQGHFLLATA